MRQLLVALFFLPSLLAFADQQPIPVEAVVYFSPDGGAQQAIVDELNKAKVEIRVQAYSFTNPQIAKAVVDAKNRGLDVVVILDKSQVTQKYSAADFLNNQDVPTYIDYKHAIAHNKIIVIDGATVITGSYNFTKAAENNNAENLLILRSQKLSDAYLKNWWFHLKHSEPYRGRL